MVSTEWGSCLILSCWAGGAYQVRLRVIVDLSVQLGLPAPCSPLRQRVPGGDRGVPSGSLPFPVRFAIRRESNFGFHPGGAEGLAVYGLDQISVSTRS